MSFDIRVFPLRCLRPSSFDVNHCSNLAVCLEYYAICTWLSQDNQQTVF